MPWEHRSGTHNQVRVQRTVLRRNCLVQVVEVSQGQWAKAKKELQVSLRKDVEMKTARGRGQLSAVDVAGGAEAGGAVAGGAEAGGAEAGGEGWMVISTWYRSELLEAILRARIPSFTVSASIQPGRRNPL